MTIRKIRRIVRIVMPVFGLSFMGWQFYSMQARNVDERLFQNSPSLLVREYEEAISFKPRHDTLGIGFLFYPGALVDPHAYVPMARQIAENGYESIIIKTPFRMAAMEWQENEVKARTLKVLDNKQWVLAGHSRGGRMALEFASSYPSKLDGLILIGTSHPRRANHSLLEIPVMKVYASSDGLASPEEVEQYRHNLPEHTSWVLIEGGNHAQFGWYGSQLGDERASISREKQQALLTSAILDFLGRL